MAGTKPSVNRPSDGVVTSSTKALSAVGVLAAVALTLLLNVLSARHYDRWDFTTSKLYTLSPATLTTLRALEQSVQVDVLLSSSDPLQRSVRNMLDVYGAETTRLEVRFIDPDRNPAEFAGVQQKYGIEAGRSEDGRVLTDAAIVVASRDRHWFITSTDLVDFSEVEDGRTKSKLEHALTGGIRAVLANDHIRICFTTGHGEFNLDDPSNQGLGELKDRLAKNNYEPVAIDGSKSDPAKTIADCSVLVVAGPGVPFSPSEADAITQRMSDGMSGFFLLNPMLDPDTKSQLDTGLEPVARRFGIGITNDYVFELDDALRVPRGTGEVFFPELKTHATTEGLMGPAQAIAGLRVVMMRSRSLSTVPGDVQPSIILSTSDSAFGMTNFFHWIEKGGDPAKSPNDLPGPLAVGVAAELPKPEASTASHGSRLVVLGSANPALGQNFRDLSLRGNAVLVGNIIAWIAARPPILDIPDKMTPAATLRITEESLSEIMRYVLLFMPGAAALLGIAVYLRRRGRDDRRTKKAPPPDEQAPNDQNAKASSKQHDDKVAKPPKKHSRKDVP
jgi:hypothetical protein